MNSAQLVGRLTRDPEVRYSDGGTTVARFTLAVDRRFKKDGGDDADFINCVAFGKTAEFLEKWFRKGQRLGLTGRIQTGSYVNQEGTKVYTTEVVVENVEFVESKGASAGDGGPQQRPAPTSAIGDGFMNIPDGVEDDGLPFN
ncbi:single-stranded DNA-binding protein [Clostridium sp. FS41]|uniref:single-stranded DNA-binding protein n=1 Tax=Clostridium sp. FS41 TaxID=1609975 RepID=UPI0005D44C43|nr:single-stranded DNA-binding protein [Clostridium sp. FS41]KJJ77632.1 single-stranded DNA-binding protein B [Clostridium sp. FS41]